MSDMNGPTVRRVHHSGGDGRRLRMATVAALGSIALLLAACAGPTSSSSPSPSPSPRTDASPPKTSAKALDPAQAERLQRVWTPLLKGMDHPLQPNQVKVGLMDDPHINAANAGNGQFLVTTGLLEKANDDRLQAVLAHETEEHTSELQSRGHLVCRLLLEKK